MKQYNLNMASHSWPSFIPTHEKKKFVVNLCPHKMSSVAKTNEDIALVFSRLYHNMLGHRTRKFLQKYWKLSKSQYILCGNAYCEIWPVRESGCQDMCISSEIKTNKDIA